jgi:hypothetical protein
MSKFTFLALGCGLVCGLLFALALLPHIASAQAPSGVPGTYQLQIATGLQQAGSSTIWRVNTATGALDFCTFSNVTVSGGNHITCQGNPK